MPKAQGSDALFDCRVAHIVDGYETDQSPRKYRRGLQCTHCGNSAGRFEQWPNHDVGYGACRPCVDWVSSLRGGLTADQIRARYGFEGRHYAASNQEQTHGLRGH